jgi:hypothetical protein
MPRSALAKREAARARMGNLEVHFIGSQSVHGKSSSPFYCHLFLIVIIVELE